ncbi:MULTISPECIES: mycofactocin-coupled SDR family oxidoreductase [Rhodococcus]|uniref:Mycofactocin-coupled SDR family oxidoreductase n=1 Tax=Rhodococcus oxybenzonivorans TaxID=1990687 RepID=A0AAE4V383_9NOCA|nr:MULTISPECIES: mycofactocin-coupled SDR family oxidoreductase [Rhodococcus]MDV7242712.1 mycofactocin-coupled SDR family oxidoreductase [Rhodococcus oxybenzonivorans]MDV7268121.1 mycofactocin-coupled SDR family oxidoreductase [Rhodococcus oxybenzonivorans]MDV7276145.1 mycofactocin-coupled SDR family oxidoreductase [Rhodococcus oxybenzonivorans]MDV7332200.1 mycofactocin-coupled SDR family oxidoreductase [Rhodococcus oxybenzonivorans]MDV7344405.1 mycofactocin-coupled SDR family oxidoreductase [
MGQLENKVAFITGAARGQGRSHAVRLAQEGADIIAVDICRPVETVPYPTATPDDLAETVRQVKALGRRVVAAEADVRDLEGLKSAVDDGVDQLGRLDIVLANAGISAPASTLEMSEEVWSTMIDINLTGVWKTCKVAVPHIIAGGEGGSVVITSSLAALKANENIAHYSAAKAGLIGFMRVLAKELAPSQIRVNTVHPTTVATEMILNDTTYRLFRPDLANPTRNDFEEAAGTLNALPVAVTEVEDISHAIVYLVAGSGRYVTGTTHVVDAGGLL